MIEDYDVCIFGDDSIYDIRSLGVNRTRQKIPIIEAIASFNQENVPGIPDLEELGGVVLPRAQVYISGDQRIRNLNTIIKGMLTNEPSRERYRQFASILRKCLDYKVTVSEDGRIDYTNERPDGYNLSDRMIKLLLALEEGLLYGLEPVNDEYVIAMNFQQDQMLRLTGSRACVFSNEARIVVNDEEIIITEDMWLSWLQNVNLVKLLTSENILNVDRIRLLLLGIASFKLGAKPVLNYNNAGNRRQRFGVSRNMFPRYRERFVFNGIAYGGLDCDNLGVSSILRALVVFTGEL